MSATLSALDSSETTAAAVGSGILSEGVCWPLISETSAAGAGASDAGASVAGAGAGTSQKSLFQIKLQKK